MSEPRHQKIGLGDRLQLGGPWFGLASEHEMRRMIGGHGGNDRGGSIALRHRWDDTWIEVETDTASFRPEREEELRAISTWFSLRIGRTHLDPNDFPISVEIEREVVDIQVDSKAIKFVVFGTGSNWMGFGRVGDRTVRLDIREAQLQSVTLKSVDPQADYSSPWSK